VVPSEACVRDGAVAQGQFAQRLAATQLIEIYHLRVAAALRDYT
jgi:hypothetical protein